MKEADFISPPPGAAEPIPYKAEVMRKAIHLLALAVPLGMAVLGKTWALTILVPLALLAVAADVLRVRSAGFARIIQMVFGSLMRKEEQPPVGGPVTINGATWVLLSAALLSWIFPIPIAVASFVMFMLSDAAAALIGRRWGHRHWGRSPRTIEGSVAFLATGLLVMVCFSYGIYPHLAYWACAVSVVAAAFAEALPRPFNDNLRVPLVSAALLFFLERFVLYQDVTLFFGM